MPADRILGALALLISAPVGVAAWRWGVGTVKAPGAGFWPLLIALAVAALGAALMLRPAPPAAPGGPPAARWTRFVVALGTLAFYVLALERLGYLPTTALLLLGQLRWVEGRGWPVSLLTAVLAAGVSFVVFRVFLGVPLPVGIVPMPRW